MAGRTRETTVMMGSEVAAAAAVLETLLSERSSHPVPVLVRIISRNEVVEEVGALTTKRSRWILRVQEI